MSSVETEYRGAMIRVETDETPAARLYINNIQRAAESASGVPCVFRLSSPVQTDYEWHEHIEAVVSCSTGSTTILLTANTQVLSERTIEACNP